MNIVAAAFAMAAQGSEPGSLPHLSLAMSASEEYESEFHGAGIIANLGRKEMIVSRCDTH